MSEGSLGVDFLGSQRIGRSGGAARQSMHAAASHTRAFYLCLDIRHVFLVNKDLRRQMRYGATS